MIEYSQQNHAVEWYQPTVKIQNNVIMPQSTLDCGLLCPYVSIAHSSLATSENAYLKSTSILVLLQTTNNVDGIMVT